MEINLEALSFAVTTTMALYLGWFYSDIAAFFRKKTMTQSICNTVKI